MQINVNHWKCFALFREIKLKRMKLMKMPLRRSHQCCHQQACHTSWAQHLNIIAWNLLHMFPADLILLTHHHLTIISLNYLGLTGPQLQAKDPQAGLQRTDQLCMNQPGLLMLALMGPNTPCQTTDLLLITLMHLVIENRPLPCITPWDLLHMAISLNHIQNHHISHHQFPAELGMSWHLAKH